LVMLSLPFASLSVCAREPNGATNNGLESGAATATAAAPKGGGRGEGGRHMSCAWTAKRAMER
jgi:hypothetical protein